MTSRRLGRAFFTVSGFTGLSRILGFVRDQLFAAVLGPGAALDAWFAAFTLPNIFRRTFAEGAMSAAFVPLLRGKLEHEGEAAAKDFARQAFTLLMVILVPLVTALILLMPWIAQTVIGYAPSDGRYEAALIFGRIMMPYLLLMSAMALIGGTLDALGQFAPKALAPTMLNIILVILLLIVWHLGLSDPSYSADTLSTADQQIATWLSWGTFGAGFAQLAIVWWPAWRLGWAPSFAIPLSMRRGMGLFLARMGPGLIANGGFQISSLVVLALASSVPGDLSHLRFADRIYQLPLGLIGIALNTVLLSTLSSLIARGENRAAAYQMNRGLELTFLLSIPIALACALHAPFLFEGFFQYGSFDEVDTQGAAAALVGYAVGIPAAVGQKVLQPAFFARQNTRTPMLHTLASILVAVILAYVLYPRLGLFGLALAASISSWTGFISLLIHLSLQKHFRLDRRLLVRLGPILLAGAGMILGLRAMLFLLGDLTVWRFVPRLMLTGGLIFLSAMIYFFLAFAFRAFNRADLQIFRNRG